jgi:hypothetical protein
LNASILFWDTSHLRSNTPDAELLEYPGWKEAVGLKDTTPDPMPPWVTFRANLDVVRTSDYPSNDSGWPVMSERMRSILHGFSGLPALREIPVRMVARGGGSETIDGRFSAVQLLEYTDAVDFDRSEYETYPESPRHVRRFRKLVLRDVPLPPLFRLASYPRKLLVRDDVRAAFEAASMRGIEYLGLERI